MNLVTFDPGKPGETPPVLTRPTKEVVDVNDPEVLKTIRTIGLELDEQIALHGKTRGIGIAAPQIGSSLRIAVLELKDGRVVLISPKITEKSEDLRLSRLGCLSAYAYRGLVRYPENVVVSFLNTEGVQTERYFDGDEAVVVQHEIDHLDGVLISSRADKGLFVPWELRYPPGSRVPFKNWGAVLSLRQSLEKLGIKTGLDIQDDTQYYSRLFRVSATNYEEYISESIKRRKELIAQIQKHTLSKGRLLEVGSGTSSHSIYFDRLGYKVTAIDLDPDMLELSKTFGKATSSSVTYIHADLLSLPFEEDTFDTAFSHGAFEHFSEEVTVRAINESLRVAKRLIISVPTLFDVSNNLMGDEHLWTARKWKRLIKRSSGNLVDAVGSFPFHSRLGRINEQSGGVLKNIAPVLVFVIEKQSGTGTST